MLCKVFAKEDFTKKLKKIRHILFLNYMQQLIKLNINIICVYVHI